MPDATIDRWIQRLTFGLMVSLALALVGVGLSLYVPRADAATHVTGSK